MMCIQDKEPFERIAVWLGMVVCMFITGCSDQPVVTDHYDHGITNVERTSRGITNEERISFQDAVMKEFISFLSLGSVAGSSEDKFKKLLIRSDLAKSDIDKLMKLVLKNKTAYEEAAPIEVALLYRMYCASLLLSLQQRPNESQIDQIPGLFPYIKASKELSPRLWDGAYDNEAFDFFAMVTEMKGKEISFDLTTYLRSLVVLALPSYSKEKIDSFIPVLTEHDKQQLSESLRDKTYFEENYKETLIAAFILFRSANLTVIGPRVDYDDSDGGSTLIEYKVYNKDKLHRILKWRVDRDKESIVPLTEAAQALHDTLLKQNAKSKNNSKKVLVKSDSAQIGKEISDSGRDDKKRADDVAYFEENYKSMLVAAFFLFESAKLTVMGPEVDYDYSNGGSTLIEYNVYNKDRLHRTLKWRVDKDKESIVPLTDAAQVIHDTILKKKATSRYNIKKVSVEGDSAQAGKEISDYRRDDKKSAEDVAYFKESYQEMLPIALDLFRYANYKVTGPEVGYNDRNGGSTLIEYKLYLRGKLHTTLKWRVDKDKESIVPLTDAAQGIHDTVLKKKAESQNNIKKVPVEGGSVQAGKEISDSSRDDKKSKNDAAKYIKRGNAFYRSKQYKKAISEYDKAIMAAPKYAPAYYNRGNTYASLTMLEQAKKDLLKALELDPALKPNIKKSSDVYKLNLKLD